MLSRRPQPSRLRCVECHTTSDASARGWKAYLAGGYEDEPLELAVCCPDCSERAFGGDESRGLDGARWPWGLAN